MSDTKEEIDLSHYDLIDGFSAHDVAYLIAGVDPTEDPNVLIGLQPVWGRIVAVRQAIKQAHHRARCALYGAVGDYEAGRSKNIDTPWWTKSNEYPPHTDCLPDSEMWHALNKLQVEPDIPIMPDGTDIPTDKALFLREDIRIWLASTGYAGAHYFWTERDRQQQVAIELSPQRSDVEALRQAEIDRLQAQVDMSKLFLEDARIKITRLEAALAQAQSQAQSGQSAVDETLPDDRDKLLRHVGALALLLAEKSGRYTSGGKPNALQIAEGVQDLLDAWPDAYRRGLGNSSLRDSISKGVALLQM
ncbi:hypothetical protein ACWKWV_06645 [Castellaniella ginsengisoli]